MNMSNEIPGAPPSNRLAESEQRFRNILWQSPSACCILSGADMVIEFANPPMLQSWQRDASVIGKPLLQVFPEMASQPFPKRLQTVYESGVAYQGQEERASFLLDGKPVETYFNYIYQPVIETDGSVSGITVIATDVTDQVVFRQQIAESERRFRALVTASSDAIYRMSPDWKTLKELQGRGFLPDSKEPVEEWLDKFINPADRPAVKAKVAAAVATKTIFEMEHRVLQQDGKEGWTFSRAVPIFDDKGEVTEWFGTASDIGRRKEAEEALAVAYQEVDRQRRLYETITSNTPDLVYVFALDYSFTYANKALLTMWGKSWDDAIGKSLIENGYEQWHAEMHEREIDTIIATKQPVRGVVSFPHAELGSRVYDYILVPVIGSNGEVEAVAGTTRDITDIKKAEEALRQSEEALEKKVLERTKELEKANGELHRSNDNLEQFAYAASHDLKEPTRKISIFVERLKESLEDRLSESEKGYMNRIESASKRMNKLIEDLLSYSEVGQDVVPDEDVDLNAVVNSVLSDLDLEIEQKGAHIQVDKLFTIKGHQRQLQQAFQNLISNALKYSRPDTAPDIRISCKVANARELALPHAPDDPEKKYHQVFVKDNGIGFSQDDAERIFNVFTRLHGMAEYKGTGVGLSIVRKVAENHGGFAVAESTPGEGARFTITFPIDK